MAIACRFCVIKTGLTLKSEYLFKTQGELNDHLEMEHDLIVQRPGETLEAAKKRAKAKNPRIGTAECRCPVCQAKRGVRERISNN